MDLSSQLATQLKEVYFGGSWTWVNLRDTLADVNWQQALHQRKGYNSIATLTYHMHYYLRVQLKVLQGGPLQGKDAESFNTPPFDSEEAWQEFLNEVWKEAEAYIQCLQELPAEKLSDIFAEEKYGTYYRNIQGLIEHTYYHLGQIVIFKKLLAESS